MSRLENKLLTESIGPFFLGEMVRNIQKIGFFILFLGSWAPPNGPKKVHTDLQVGWRYVHMSKFENGPLTKSIGPFL
jgi:hypothetical protein